MHRAWFLGFAIAAALASSAPIARAQQLSEEDSEARVHFRLGNVYYESGRFAEAAGEFQQAYDLSHRPALLYNIFVAHRDAGNLGPAIQALREYLRLVPDAEQHEQLTARLRSMERLHQERGGEAAPAEPAQPTETTATATATTATTNTTTTIEPAQTRGAETWVPGWIIAGVGGALVVAGVVTGVLALDAQSQLAEICDPDGACDPGFEPTRDSAALLAGLTDGFIIGGGVIAAAGVVLALVLATSGEESPSAGVFCGPDGCMGAVRAQF